MDYLKEYCDATSLHGWFFYGGSTSDKKTSISGFFWLAVLVGSMSAAVFVMGTTIQGINVSYISSSLSGPLGPTFKKLDIKGSFNFLCYPISFNKRQLFSLSLKLFLSHLK
jgi:hypothetical protein